MFSVCHRYADHLARWTGALMHKLPKSERGYRSRREAVCFTAFLFVYLWALSVVPVVWPEQFWNVRNALLLHGAAAVVALSVAVWWQRVGRRRFPLPAERDQGRYVPQWLRWIVKEQSADVQQRPE